MVGNQISDQKILNRHSTSPSGPTKNHSLFRGPLPLSFSCTKALSFFPPFPSPSSPSQTPKFQSIVKVDGTWKGQSSGTARSRNGTSQGKEGGESVDTEARREKGRARGMQLKISRDRFAGDRDRLLQGELRHLQHSITFIGGVDHRWR